MDSGLQISDLQSHILGIPLDIQGIALFGGKGGAKSWALMLLANQWGELYGPKARCLILRRHYPDLEGLVAAGMDILSCLYGPKAARRMYNGSDSFFKLPNGSYIQLGGLHHELDHLRYRGRSWNFLGIDEFPQYDGPRLPNMIRAELRAAEPIKPRIVYTGNPGLQGHDYVERTFIRTPWEPWIEAETGLKWIYVPSTAFDNPFIDPVEHERQIAAIAQYDKDLAEALQTGDFSAIKGGEFFGDAWKERYSVIDDWHTLPDYSWAYKLAADHGGGSAPTACLFFALALESAYDERGNFFPRGSLVIFDEHHDAIEGSWNETLGWPISKNCEAICRIADSYEMRASGLVDPQVCQDHGDDNKLIDTYTDNGVHLTPWPKHRRSAGAALVRELMHHAAPPEHRTKPGLYVTRRCKGFLGTVPRLPRDKRDRTDVDTTAADHWYDALRGAAHYRRKAFTVEELLV